jgi:exonuclease VII small subunit
MSDNSEPTTTAKSALREAISLVEYRRELLSDALHDLSEARKRVQRCRKSLEEAQFQMAAEVLASSTVVPMS